MRPLVIFFLGVGALWALQRSQKTAAGQGIVLPQTQRGISVWQEWPTPQQPQQVYASMMQPPGSSVPAGYVPAFGPYFGTVDPNSLYWNQA